MVVTNAGVTSPGVSVVADLPAIGAQVVRGTAAALDALRADPAVAGYSPSASVRFAGDAYGSRSSASVLAPASVGGAAGEAWVGAGVNVAVIDTGVSDSQQLNRRSGRIVDAVDTSGLNAVGGTIRERGPFTDGYGHGTFMASLIAGGPIAGSALGVGVAPAATISVVKVADDDGTTSLGAVLAGLNWVATHADTVDVANLSLSVERPSAAYGVDPLTYAVELTRARGVTVVVAAGNDPKAVGDPGFAPAALTVGAADTTGTTPAVAAFSGRSAFAGVGKPDVVAAGVGVLGVMPADTIIARQNPGARQQTGLFRGSGTSEATAITSGVAAAFKQSFPRATPHQVKAAIRGAATTDARGRRERRRAGRDPDADSGRRRR